MAGIRKEHENRTGNHADHRRQHLEKNLLLRHEIRIETAHGVGVQERQGGEDDDREKSVDKVSEPKLVLGQVLGARGRPQAGTGDDAVVSVAAGIGVAIGEGGETAGDAAEGDEDGV